MSTDGCSPTKAPRCVCSWSNCENYRTGFSLVRHAEWGGRAVPVRLAPGNPRSDDLQASLDRTLGVKDCHNNKAVTRQRDGTVVYHIARHHFTTLHIKLWQIDPDRYSFLDLFTAKRARKYLYKVNYDESCGDCDENNNIASSSAAASSKPMYLQCPNVPELVVKAKFQKLGRSSSCSEIILEEEEEDVDDVTTASTALTALSEVQENCRLKDNLSVMSSQIGYLHDQIRKLQEQMTTTPSCKSNPVSTPTSSSSSSSSSLHRRRGSSSSSRQQSQRFTTVREGDNELDDDDDDMTIRTASSRRSITSASSFVLPREAALDNRE